MARDSSPLPSESQRSGCVARPRSQTRRDPEASSRGSPPHPPETRPQPRERPARSPPPPSAPAWEPPDCGELRDLRFRDLFGAASPGGESAGPGLRCPCITRGRATAGKRWERAGGLGRSLWDLGIPALGRSWEPGRLPCSDLHSYHPPALPECFWRGKGPLLSPHWVPLSQLHQRRSARDTPL